MAHRATNLASIDATKLKVLPVLVLPDSGEQKEIARILKTADDKIEVNESKRRCYQDLFKTLLHKLMTAELRVNDLDIETSEVDGA